VQLQSLYSCTRYKSILVVRRSATNRMYDATKGATSMVVSKKQLVSSSNSKNELTPSTNEPSSLLQTTPVF
jgi:hypothetical protein